MHAKTGGERFLQRKQLRGAAARAEDSADTDALVPHGALWLDMARDGIDGAGSHSTSQALSLTHWSDHAVVMMLICRREAGSIEFADREAARTKLKGT